MFSSSLSTLIAFSRRQLDSSRHLFYGSHCVDSDSRCLCTLGIQITFDCRQIDSTQCCDCIDADRKKAGTGLYLATYGFLLLWNDFRCLQQKSIHCDDDDTDFTLLADFFYSCSNWGRKRASKAQLHNRATVFKLAEMTLSFPEPSGSFLLSLNEVQLDTTRYCDFIHARWVSIDSTKPYGGNARVTEKLFNWLQQLHSL